MVLCGVLVAARWTQKACLVLPLLSALALARLVSLTHPLAGPLALLALTTLHLLPVHRQVRGRKDLDRLLLYLPRLQGFL